MRKASGVESLRTERGEGGKKEDEEGRDEREKKKYHRAVSRQGRKKM